MAKTLARGTSAAENRATKALATLTNDTKRVAQKGTALCHSVQYSVDPEAVTGSSGVPQALNHAVRAAKEAPCIERKKMDEE